ncbi:MAG: hypothetical protein ABI614_01035, partial [Planctomycetota bacterium]
LLDRYASIDSKSLGVSLWFWWKGYYREQIAEPQCTVEPDDSMEVVLYEVRLTPPGLANATLPFGLSFPATPDSVNEAMGRKPFSKSKNFLGEPVWTYYDDRFELLVIFEANGVAVGCYKIFALKMHERRKLQLLENLKEQKKNLLPERVPEIEAATDRLPTAAWERRRKSGDKQFTTAGITAVKQVLEAFIADIANATSTRNAKSIYTAVTKATKAINKVARQHSRMIETMEREEIVDFFHATVRLTGFELDASFDLTEEHRSW